MKSFKKSISKYMPRHSRTDVEKNYKFGKEIGSGNFAVVKLATKRETGDTVAVKIIDKELCKGKEELIESEVEIASRVHHPHLVGLHEVYDTTDRLYLVMDYIEGGELFDRIVTEGSFTEQDAARIIRQMCEAVSYLHAIHIVHRDLKPENVLFKGKEATSDIIIADFGLSKLLDDNVMLKTACGTPSYVAPEVLMQNGYGKEVDMWAIGVIAYILLCGYPPFYDENDAALFQKILKGQFDFNPTYWGEISDSAKHLIRHLLEVDPAARFTADQALAHPWVTGKTARTINLSQSFSTNFKRYNLMLAEKGNAAAAPTIPIKEYSM